MQAAPIGSSRAMKILEERMGCCYPFPTTHLPLSTLDLLER